MMKKSMSISHLTALFTLLLLLASCSSPPKMIEQQVPLENSPTENAAETTLYNWLETPLADIATGETFSLSDFAGKKVLVESFAVWCPVCTQQQEEIKKLHELLGEEVVSVSLDTDPNEDAALVAQALQERGFTWRFAVAPRRMTEALLAEFGQTVAYAPAAPVILICENQISRFLPRGVKDVEELQEELAKGC